MKKLLCIAALALLGALPANAQQYEYKVITSVESIVPAGVGRSRLISSSEERNYQDFTSKRTAQDKGRNKSDRSQIRVKNFEETKLLNFFNLGGIRFENIAANDFRNDIFSKSLIMSCHFRASIPQLTNIPMITSNNETKFLL